MHLNCAIVIITIGTIQNTSAVTITWIGWPLFMTGRIQNQQSKYVDIPHSIDAGEKCRGEFQIN